MTLQKAPNGTRNVQVFGIQDKMAGSARRDLRLVTNAETGSTWMVARDSTAAALRVNISPEDLWHLREYLNSAEIPEHAFREPIPKPDEWQDGDSVEGAEYATRRAIYVRVGGEWRCVGRLAAIDWRCDDSAMEDFLASQDWTPLVRGGKQVHQR